MRRHAAATTSQLRAGSSRKRWCPAATARNARRGSRGRFAGGGDQRLRAAVPIVYRAQVGGKRLGGWRAAAAACPRPATAAAAAATTRCR